MVPISALVAMYESGMSYSDFCKLTVETLGPAARTLVQPAWVKSKKADMMKAAPIMTATRPSAQAVREAKARIADEVPVSNMCMFMKGATQVCRELRIIDPHRKMLVSHCWRNVKRGDLRR